LALALLVITGARVGFAGTKVEDIPRICSDLPPQEKPVVGVMDFAEKAGVAGIGGGMATMLLNALLGTGCFDVVETERMKEVLAEQELGLSGLMEESTAPAIGKMAGAQFLVMGTITEFKEGESAGSGVSPMPRSCCSWNTRVRPMTSPMRWTSSGRWGSRSQGRLGKRSRHGSLSDSHDRHRADEVAVRAPLALGAPGARGPHG
jgi:hypothetical protein